MRFGIYALHLVFWLPFVVRALSEWTRSPSEGAQTSSRFPSGLVLLHSAGVAVSYTALGFGIFAPGALPGWPWLQVAGGAVVLGAAALATWALLVFRSWRLKAELASSHELCTDGPYRYVRHPIYTAMLLLSVGTALWLPTLGTALGVVAMAVTGDVRARAEERLLSAHFGARYVDYLATARRFVPFVY